MFVVELTELNPFFYALGSQEEAKLAISQISILLG